MTEEHEQMIEDCIARQDRMSAWECNFIDRKTPNAWHGVEPLAPNSEQRDVLLYNLYAGAPAHVVD